MWKLHATHELYVEHILPNLTDFGPVVRRTCRGWNVWWKERYPPHSDTLELDPGNRMLALAHGVITARRPRLLERGRGTREPHPTRPPRKYPKLGTRAAKVMIDLVRGEYWSLVTWVLEEQKGVLTSEQAEAILQAWRDKPTAGAPYEWRLGSPQIIALLFATFQPGTTVYDEGGPLLTYGSSLLTTYAGAAEASGCPTLARVIRCARDRATPPALAEKLAKAAEKQLRLQMTVAPVAGNRFQAVYGTLRSPIAYTEALRRWKIENKNDQAICCTCGNECTSMSRCSARFWGASAITPKACFGAFPLISMCDRCHEYYYVDLQQILERKPNGTHVYHPMPEDFDMKLEFACGLRATVGDYWWREND